MMKREIIDVTSIVLGGFLLPVSPPLSVAPVWAQDAPATLAGPLTFGSPDQPYGIRRPVTDADRAAIQSYRSGRKTPVFSTTFTDPVEFRTNWDTIEDDKPDLLSCRRAANAVPSNIGLRLETKIATDCHNKWSTAHIASKARYSYGYFETSLKIADIDGMNNAFWVTSDDNYEVDPDEIHYPNFDHIAVHFWPPKGAAEKPSTMGYNAKLSQNLSAAFHDYGFLWTPMDLIFAVDGEPIAAIRTQGLIRGPMTLRYSTALANWAGKVPDRPEGHPMSVRSLRVFKCEDGK
ncbi:glycoside hydrolase family 16 protein [Telmatospirillum sp.]|uniref:glycoside hydrolase family 16 protein n=1 Tax=Telmatospirillum sp. TaxID=2079197 RepID=UPI00284A8A35|nr:glycoside hydrolase family 16 protein [Telmatospirillum sp.]MDR3439281.1 glycoside hydrolase family 16 protein [Telmatospirillum sp.]